MLFANCGIDICRSKYIAPQMDTLLGLNILYLLHVVKTDKRNAQQFANVRDGIGGNDSFC